MTPSGDAPEPRADMTTIDPRQRDVPTVAAEPPPPRAAPRWEGRPSSPDGWPEIGPVVWGLGARELHAARWASRGVQCVARGRRIQIDRTADLYLLLEPGQLVDFDPKPHLETLLWHNRRVARIRVLDGATPDYREQVVLDEAGYVIKVERRYRARYRGSARVLLTADRRLAEAWSEAATRRAGWRAIRAVTPWRHVETERAEGETAWVGSAEDERRFAGHLVATWSNPGRAISGLRHRGDGVWTTIDETPPEDAVLVGPLWLGAGAVTDPAAIVVGPDLRPDQRSPELPVAVRRIREIDPATVDEAPRKDSAEGPGAGQELAKRFFDVAFAAGMLLALLPLFVVVGIAVLIEDGRPIFYAQTREGRGGRIFRCWKFRSMYSGSEAKARELQHANASDGPHVNITDDPRVTRVGRVIRKLQVDELPQFWCVLRGDMSVVGPRPSPERENQLCPAWRELRLSVKPGITGLWQIRRTRRKGEDFQEWIRYDIEYVQRRSFGLDLKICVLTAWMMLRGRKSLAEE